jgi:hypothetical protein
MTTATTTDLCNALIGNYTDGTPILLDEKSTFVGTDGANEAVPDFVVRLAEMPLHY